MGSIMPGWQRTDRLGPRHQAWESPKWMWLFGNWWWYHGMGGVLFHAHNTKENSWMIAKKERFGVIHPHAYYCDTCDLYTPARRIDTMVRMHNFGKERDGFSR